jgi:AAA domain-containing protein
VLLLCRMTQALPIIGTLPNETHELVLPKKTTDSLSNTYTEVIIEGLLRKTELLLLGGSAKKMKSWAMLDLIYCIINGFSWLKFPCHKGIVIHFDLELHEASLRERLELINSSYCQAGYRGSLDGLFCVPLRNEDFGPAQLNLITKQLHEKFYAVLSIDPIYRFLLGKGENDPVAVCELLTRFQKIANALGCAIALTQHFPKGDQSEKDAIDRFSGSSVWGRFPDSLITFTAHEKENCSSVNFIVRSFNQIDPFVVRWSFPRYRVDEGLDPEDLKTRKKPGAKRKTSAEQVCLLLSPEEKCSYTAWCAKACAAFEITTRTFDSRKNEALSLGLVRQDSDGLYSPTNFNNGDH